LDIAYSKQPFKLSWTHYQVLIHIEDKDERDFYEKVPYQNLEFIE